MGSGVSVGADPPPAQRAGAPAPVTEEEFMRRAGGTPTGGSSDASTAGARPTGAPVSEEEFFSRAAGQGPAVGADDGPMAPINPEHPDAQAFFDHLANTVSFGLGPKAVAAVQGIGDALHGEGYDYGARLDAMRRMLAAEDAASPGASTVGSVAGAVTSPVGLGIERGVAKVLPAAAGVLGRIGRAAVTGGALGGAYAAGTGDGSLSDRAAQVATGTAGGAVAGGLIGAVGGIAGKVLSFFHPPSAADQLASAVTTAEPASTSASRMPADQARDLARYLRGQSPAARETIDEALAARAKQQFQRVAATLADGMGVDPASTSQDIADQITSMKAAAAPHYDVAYRAPPITDPDFVKAFRALATTAGGKSAYEAGARIAEVEGDPLPPISKGGGEPDWIAGMRAALGRDPTPEELQLASAHNPSLAPPTGPGVSVRQLDYFKRGLDALIDARQGSTATLNRQEGRALRMRLNGLLQQADQLVPEYGVARQTAAQGFGLEEAAALGRDHFASPSAATPEDVATTVATMSEPERRVYTQAAVGRTLDNLQATAGSATGRADLVSKLWSSIGGRDKLLAIAQSPAQGAQMAQALEDLANENETRAYVSRGSQTAPQASLASRFASGIRRVVPSPWVALEAAHGSPAAWTYIASRVPGALRTSGASAAADALAPLLVRPGASLSDIVAAAQSAPTPAAGGRALDALTRAAALRPVTGAGRRASQATP